MYSPIKSRRLYEQVVDHIQDLITRQEIGPGDRLPNERELALRFGVSRTVVREALKTLVDRGLVEVRSGQGAFVVDGTAGAFVQSLQLMISLDSSDHAIADLVEVREFIEPEIAYRAALRATAPDVAAMRAAVETMDAHMDSMSIYIRADDDFHLALARGTQNAFAPRLLHSIVDVLHELRGQIFQVRGGPERGQQHHRRILRAIEDKAPEAAREAMRAHLRQVWDDSRQAVAAVAAVAAPAATTATDTTDATTATDEAEDA